MMVAEDVIVDAAKWLVANRERLRAEGHSRVVAVKERFGMNNADAIEAIRHADAAECKGL